jgi:DNA-binding GntR family transcriptional regulator
MLELKFLEGYILYMGKFKLASDTDTTITSKLSEHDIVDRIYSAVLEQRLPANTKLSESTLCETFGVGRMKVRQALLLLSSQGIVNIKSNHGAFIACPDKKESTDVFGARLALEPSVVRQVALIASDQKLEALKTIITQEQQARVDGNRRESIRLSGEFHVQLAEATGNLVLKRMVLELVTRTSLIVGLFGTQGDNSCGEDEHLDILNALYERNTSKVARLAYKHIEHIESSLNLPSESERQLDVQDILRG